MLDKGYWCVAVTPPTVSPDTCRIRLTVSAMHDREHIDGLLEGINEVSSQVPAFKGIVNNYAGDAA